MPALQRDEPARIFFTTCPACSPGSIRQAANTSRTALPRCPFRPCLGTACTLQGDRWIGAFGERGGGGRWVGGTLFSFFFSTPLYVFWGVFFITLCVPLFVAPLTLFFFFFCFCFFPLFPFPPFLFPFFFFAFRAFFFFFFCLPFPPQPYSCRHPLPRSTMLPK